MGSLYRSAGIGLAGELVYTNKHPGGQFRGYGRPQATFAVESQMDELAAEPGWTRSNSGREHQPGGRCHPCRIAARVGATGRLSPGRRGTQSAGGKKARRQRPRRRNRNGDTGLRCQCLSRNRESGAALDRRLGRRGHVRFGGADAGTGQKTAWPRSPPRSSGARRRVEVVMMESDRRRSTAAHGPVAGRTWRRPGRRGAGGRAARLR